ncbi:MAG TPA: hypothetical protein VNK81_00745 [Thermodesulfobacteriota bacterium]|jgi:hypothetical protein|nr:hypothetical protein [Thermodesulfobacteriota bacterium]
MRIDTFYSVKGLEGGNTLNIEKAIQIGEREWENIRTSLEACGDIGEFRITDEITGTSEGSLLTRSIIGMDERFSTHGYFTQEAAFVFKTLASRAGKRLGLPCKLAQDFGSGYSWVRTGWFDTGSMEEKQSIIRQLFFFRIFFPVGGYFDWDFNSPMVKAKLKLIFSKFVEWQNGSEDYTRDLREYRGQLESLCRGLDSTWLIL